MIAGRYSREREIGRGGTGAVWLGRDELLGRQVALKRIGLLPGADRTDVARAEREARLSAQLHHPHVVAVFDVVDDPDTGDSWLVMEYVDGITLDRLVRERGPLSPDAAAPLLRQAADALVAAHGAGIVHRDVKPSNILVAADGRLKLTDFGIARATEDVSLTQTGLMTGSPAYLAPEIAAGGRAGPAADVWSLGATAYHLLSGRPPYDVGDNVLGALYRIVHEDPPRLENAGRLAPLLVGTLVRDLERRWSMTQVRDFLSGAAAAEPSAPEPSAQEGTVPVPVPVPVAGAVEPPESTAQQAPQPVPESQTRVLDETTPAPAAEPPPDRRRPTALVLGLGALAVLVLAIIVVVALSRDSGSGPQAKDEPGSATTTPPARPSAKTMEAFIRDYVRTVADDPDRAWLMLTPKFQRESGGLDRYRAFWDGATNGRVLSISADPTDLSVSYQVHFDDFDNGPGPTVLDLVYKRGRYYIDGERSKGFTPAG